MAMLNNQMVNKKMSCRLPFKCMSLFAAKRLPLSWGLNRHVRRQSAERLGLEVARRGKTETLLKSGGVV